MTLWIDRRSAFPSEQPVTHVLIVGTSEYKHLPGGCQPAPPGISTLDLGQVHSACAGAFAFARWIRDHYREPDAPLATVRLLLAPSREEVEHDPELATVATSSAVPTRGAVQQAVDDWERDSRQNPRGVAILYAGGHGIQFARENQSILLHDFAETQRLADNTLDIGSIFRGMVGDNHPDRQWYFIDSCRYYPAELLNWSYLGAGVGLAGRAQVEDVRCAPIFSAAASGTVALGKRGKGTIFSQALVECLSKFAAVVDERGDYKVTVYSLARALKRRVAELAAAFGREQIVSTYGAVDDAVVHSYREVPQIELTIEIRPGVAYPHALADLWQDSRVPVFTKRPFPAAELVCEVPLGIYVLDVLIVSGQPFTSCKGVICVVDPYCRKIIDVSNGMSLQ